MIVAYARRCMLEKQNKAHHIFDVHIGGVFAEPKKTKVNPSQAKKSLATLLNSTKDIVERVWDLGKYELSDDHWSFEDTVLGRVVKDEFKNITYSWLYPLIFRLKVNKGISYSRRNKPKRKTLSSIDAIILYNGLWFMALVDNNQFSTFDEYFFSGPNIRDILIGMLERNKLFVPVVVPPCIIPKPFNVELHTKEEKEENRFPQYINTSRNEDSPKFTVKYQTETTDITDEDIIEIMKDIYFDVGSSLNSFYILAAESKRTQDERRNVSEMYDQACNYLQEYMKIPFWNIFRKCRVASALSKDVSNIQVQLVNNRLSQVRILNKAEEINTLEDSKGIIRNMREYLKQCVVKDFNLGTVEYEGLVATLSHIERLASQHNIILLGLVAIIAGLVGVVIGAWIG